MEGNSSHGRQATRSPKAGLTPLEPTGLLEARGLAALARHSITTAEELLGVIVAAPAPVAELLPGIDVERLRAGAAAVADEGVSMSIDAAPEQDRSLGTRVPPDVAVEDPALGEPENESGWRESSNGHARAIGAEVDPSLDPEPTRPREACLLPRLNPVRDQGCRPTGVAHAVCALVEEQQRRLRDARETLSPQFLHWDAKLHDDSPDRAGTTLEVAMTIAAGVGACREEIWPYEPEPRPGDDAHGPPPPGAATDALERRLIAPIRLHPNDASGVRAFLAEQIPVAVSIPVYDDWLGNPFANEVGLIPMPLRGSRLRGGQALCAVGYRWDSAFPGGGCFVLRNSWGTGWAPRSPVAPGHAVLPFLYLEQYGWEAWTTLGRDPLE